MAIPTFVAGNILTAAQLNTISSAFTIVDAWTSFTPSLTQSGAVTKTVTVARYAKFGRLVVAQVYLDITGAGTANNQIVLGMPPPLSVAGANQSFGVGAFTDTSLNLIHPFNVRNLTTSTVRLLGQSTSFPTSTSFLGMTGSSTGVALASGDVIECIFMYESTT